MIAMKKPVLSVIIPYYRGESYIENTVASVLNSTLKDLEILLIDDGSPGDSGKKCDQLAFGIENVVAIHKENGGIADARNRGIREASGKYIAFVDQDDTIDPEMYLSLIGILEQNGCDLITSNFLVTNIRSGKQEISDSIKKDALLSGGGLEDLRKWLVMGEVMTVPEVRIPPNIWNCVISSDLIKRNDIRFESFIRYDDDWVFLLRCLAYSKKVFLCKKAYYNWLIHDDSESHTARYIPDIVTRYENLKRFKTDYIKKWCSVGKDEMEAFAAYFNVNTAYVTICNEAVGGNELSVSRNIIQGVLQKNKSEDVSKEAARNAVKALVKKKGTRAGAVYKLAYHHLIYLALSACRIKK